MSSATRTLARAAVPAEVLRRLVDAFIACAERGTSAKTSLRLEVEDTTWEFDNLEDFFDRYRAHAPSAELTIEQEAAHLRFLRTDGIAELSVALGSPADVVRVIDVLGMPLEERDRADSHRPIVFVGHGREDAWRAIEDHLSEAHGFNVVTHENSAGVGELTINTVLGLARRAQFAVLVHTTEVVDEAGNGHASPNVIHDTGVFQAALGLARTVVVREEGCSVFGNVAGMTEIRFPPGNVHATLGDVAACIYTEIARR